MRRDDRNGAERDGAERDGAERDGAERDGTDEVVVSLPFTGRWIARNSPARRVPSHGIDVFGQRFAIDFARVDDRRRTSAIRDWRTLLSSEPAQRYYGFGQRLLAPASGVVVTVHDGEPDHAGRRSQLALVAYMLGQPRRMRDGIGAVAGNHIVIALPGRKAFVALAHLRNGSALVAVGDSVHVGQPIAECGNSGNSTQPHVHMQVMDSADLSIARGVPMAFREFREQPRSREAFRDRAVGVPGEGAVVEPRQSDGPTP